jgi:hypothetical protein
VVHKVGEYATVVVEDDRPFRNGDHQVVGARAVHVLALAVLAVAGAPVRVITERQE